MPPPGQHSLGPDRVAIDAFTWSRPLLRLAGGGTKYLWDGLAKRYPAHRDAWGNLVANPSGPAAVAAAIMDQLYTIRSVEFALTAATPVSVPVFTQLPGDQEHFAIPYLPYVLRSCRHHPLAYVQEVLDDHDPRGPRPPHIKGVVVATDY